MKEKRSGSRKEWYDPDDAPELTEAWFASADLYHGRKLVRRGRPIGSGTKQLISLRVDKNAIATFRATGPGWQARINDAIVRSAKRMAAK